MDEATLLHRLTTIYQLLDQIRCSGHQNHKYLSASMDGVLNLMQEARCSEMAAEEGQTKTGE